MFIIELMHLLHEESLILCVQVEHSQTSFLFWFTYSVPRCKLGIYILHLNHLYVVRRHKHCFLARSIWSVTIDFMKRNDYDLCYHTGVSCEIKRRFHLEKKWSDDCDKVTLLSILICHMCRGLFGSHPGSREGRCNSGSQNLQGCSKSDPFVLCRWFVALAKVKTN